MLMHFLVVMLRSSTYHSQSNSFITAEKIWPALHDGVILTGSLDGRTLENAHYDIGTGLAGHNSDDNIRQPSKFAVTETCVQCQH